MPKLTTQIKQKKICSRDFFQKNTYTALCFEALEALFLVYSFSIK